MRACRSSRERKLHEDVVGVGVAASGAGAATLAATVSVAELSDTTLAAVKNMTGTNHSLDIDAERVANTHSYNNVIALSGSVGSGNVGCGELFLMIRAILRPSLCMQIS